MAVFAFIDLLNLPVGFMTIWRMGEQAPSATVPLLPVLQKIFQISERKNCKETIFTL